MMRAPTEKQLRAMTPEQRMTVRSRAAKLGGELGAQTIALIDSLNLPLSSGGMPEDHPLYREMQEIIWSAEGQAAAFSAAENDLPAMAGIDPLLQSKMGVRYGRESMGTTNAGFLVCDLMRNKGYVESGRGDLPSDCIAKTAVMWRLPSKT